MTSQLQSRVRRLETAQAHQRHPGIAERIFAARKRLQAEEDALARLHPDERAAAIAERDRQRREQHLAVLTEPDLPGGPNGSDAELAARLQRARRRVARHELSTKE